MSRPTIQITSMGMIAAMGSRNVEAAWDERVGGGGGGEDSPSGTEQRERIVFIYILEEGRGRE